MTIRRLNTLIPILLLASFVAPPATARDPLKDTVKKIARTTPPPRNTMIIGGDDPPPPSGGGYTTTSYTTDWNIPAWGVSGTHTTTGTVDQFGNLVELQVIDGAGNVLLSMGPAEILQVQQLAAAIGAAPPRSTAKFSAPTSTSLQSRSWSRTMTSPYGNTITVNGTLR